MTPSSTAPVRGKLVLVRHGETDWSAGRQHTGRTDVPLNDTGRAQAQALAPLLAGVRLDRVLASPLVRAHDTARLAGLTGIEVEPLLQEWDYGGYEGRTTAEISEELGRSWSVWSDGVVPGATPGESLAEVRARCETVLSRLLPEVEDGRTVALVAHGHLLRIFATAWLDVEPTVGALLALSAGSVCVLDVEHDRRVVGVWATTPGPLR